MFHPSTNVPRGTLYGASVEHYTGQARNIIRGKRGTLCEAVAEDDTQQAMAVSQNTIIFYLKAILLAFVFVMFFDHYLWDIQQGQIMLWAILGLIVAINRKQLFG